MRRLWLVSVLAWLPAVCQYQPPGGGTGGGGGAPSGPAGGVLAGTYPNPGMAAGAAVANITFTPPNPANNLSEYRGTKASFTGLQIGANASTGDFDQFTDTFDGSTFNIGNWSAIGTVTQNGNVSMTGDSHFDTQGITTMQSYRRTKTLTLTLDITPNNYTWFGWSSAQNVFSFVSPETRMSHTMYFPSGGNIQIYEKGVLVNTTSFTWVVATTYRSKIVLNTGGAFYYISSNAGDAWTLLYDGTGNNVTDSPLFAAWGVFTGTSSIDNVSIDNGWDVLSKSRLLPRVSGSLYSTLTGVIAPGINALAFGDSVTLGTGATTGYVPRIASSIGWQITNSGTTGAMTEEAGIIDNIFGTTVNQTTNSITLLGYNDSHFWGSAQNSTYDATMRSALAWLAIPEARKIRASSGSVAYTGTWSNSANTYSTLVGKSSTNVGATATATVNGRTVYIGITRLNGGSGQVSVTVDGVSLGTFNNSGNAVPNSGRTYSPYLIRIPYLSDAPHIVVVTVVTATAYLDWFAGSAGASTVQGPNVYAGNTLYMPSYSPGAPYNNGSDAATAQYNDLNRAAASDLAADGLNVAYVDAAGRYQVANSSSFHPNDTGAQQVADAFIDGITGFSLPRSRTVKPSGAGAPYQIAFQPGLMTSVLGTTGVYGQISRASTVDNLIGSAIAWACATNPVVTMFECGTSATCATPTTIGTVTITAAGQAFVGTVSSAAITAGDYIGWSVSAGTCTSLDLSATAQVHTN